MTCPEPAPDSIRGALEIRNLTFQYPNSMAPVLTGISLTVPAGTTLAIVGHTGSGKSTLVNLVPRLFNPPPGTVFVDGKDVCQWPLSELRKNIGYVPQETFLFSDTIRENIAFGNNSGITDREVDWAAHVSQIAEDINTFSDKMQTYVGEREITLSGGKSSALQSAGLSLHSLKSWSSTTPCQMWTHIRKRKSSASLRKS